jgi:hypothetical protein
VNNEQFYIQFFYVFLDFAIKVKCIHCGTGTVVIKGNKNISNDFSIKVVKTLKEMSVE